MRQGRALGARSAALGTAIAVAALLRRRYLRWGATDDEVSVALPGDELVPRPDMTATRGVTIRATADSVWPWIAQLGQGRGGFYSYDFLENLIGCDIHSADRIVPEYQHVEIGAQVRLAPEVALTVALVEPQCALVLRGGIPMGPMPAPYDFTWAFVLRAEPDGSTRLVVRERYGYLRRWTPLVVEPAELISFVMSQRMLRSLRSRAEKADSVADKSQNAGARPALLAIKAAHTLVWFSIESCMVYVLYAGLVNRTDRRAAIAAAVIAAESLVFAANGFRCPLTDVAESLGAEHGSVTDIYLPARFARNLPAIHVPLLALALFLHGRNLRRQRAVRRATGWYTSP
jgi:hypothetical protein